MYLKVLGESREGNSVSIEVRKDRMVRVRCSILHINLAVDGSFAGIVVVHPRSSHWELARIRTEDDT